MPTIASLATKRKAFSPRDHRVFIFSAKLLAKGGDTTLGWISAVIALSAVVGTLYLMYGTFPIISIISVAVSASFAYRIASS